MPKGGDGERDGVDGADSTRELQLTAREKLLVTDVPPAGVVGTVETAVARESELDLSSLREDPVLIVPSSLPSAKLSMLAERFCSAVMRSRDSCSLRRYSFEKVEVVELVV